jgi:hypothetical protein
MAPNILRALTFMVIGSACVINSVIARILHRGDGSFPVHFPTCLNQSNYVITFNGRLCGHHLVHDRGIRWIFGLQLNGSGLVCHGTHEDHPHSAFGTHKPAPKKIPRVQSVMRTVNPLTGSRLVTMISIIIIFRVARAAGLRWREVLEEHLLELLESKLNPLKRSVYEQSCCDRERTGRLELCIR